MAATKSLADKLLDAQVAWVVDELTGKHAADNIARDVTDLLDYAAGVKLADAADADAVKDAARRLVDVVGASPLVGETVTAISDAVYDLEASDAHVLGDVVERDPVEALIVKIISMRQLQDRALERMTQSPVVASVTAKFVTKIVADFVAQNRARAEKVPGVGSMLKIGSSAANRMKSPFDKQIDALLGDAADKGAATALKRTNKAVKELISEAPLREAAMEVWDLHAAEPIGELREYLTQQDLREVALLVHDIVVSVRGSEFAGEVVDAVVDTLYATHGDKTIATLLVELGLTRDHLVEEAQRLLPPLLAQAKASGELQAHARKRLAGFYASPKVAKLLAEA